MPFPRLRKVVKSMFTLQGRLERAEKKTKTHATKAEHARTLGEEAHKQYDASWPTRKAPGSTERLLILARAGDKWKRTGARHGKIAEKARGKAASLRAKLARKDARKRAKK